MLISLEVKHLSRAFYYKGELTLGTSYLSLEYIWWHESLIDKTKEEVISCLKSNAFIG